MFKRNLNRQGENLKLDLLFFSLMFILASCASDPYEPLDPSNIRSRATYITRMNTQFFEGTTDNPYCLPPDEKKNCRKVHAIPYRPTKKLDNFGYLEFSIAEYSPSFSSKADELVHLVASELTNQENYKMFVITKITDT